MRLRVSSGIFFLCLAGWALADGGAPPVTLQDDAYHRHGHRVRHPERRLEPRTAAGANPGSRRPASGGRAPLGADELARVHAERLGRRHPDR